MSVIIEDEEEYVEYDSTGEPYVAPPTDPRQLNVVDRIKLVQGWKQPDLKDDDIQEDELEVAFDNFEYKLSKDFVRTDSVGQPGGVAPLNGQLQIEECYLPVTATGITALSLNGTMAEVTEEHVAIIPTTSDTCAGLFSCEEKVKLANINPNNLATKQELNAKQDTLTAGTNITIDENNVISATGGGVTYTAGANIQISNQNVISATDTIYDDTQVKSDITALQSSKLNVLPKVDDPSDPGFGWEYHIPYSFDAVPDAEKLNITLKTLTLDNKVTKMNFNKNLPSATNTTAGLMSAADKVALSNKQDKLTAGTDIVIENNVIGTQVKFVEISGTSGTFTDDEIQILSNSQLSYIMLGGKKFELRKAVVGRSGIVATYGYSFETNADSIEVQISSKTWEYRQSQVQSALTAGDNITISNNIISSIDTKVATSITLGKSITAQSAIGGIPAGKVYAATDTLAQIIEDLLGGTGPTPPVGTKYLYTGIVNSIPESITGMTQVEADKDTLLTSGYTFKNITTNGQYAVLAIDKDLGLSCYSIKVNGFDMGFLTKDLGTQTLYYFEEPTYETSARYVYSFEEV